MFDLSKRVAVITGASSGLGVQFAEALIRQGADVAILARRKDKLEAVAENLRKLGKRVLPVPCDVTNVDEIKKAVQTVLAEYGKVDILVNNAGTGFSSKAEDFPVDKWQQVMELNINAIFYCCREFAKPMLKAGYGRVINIASMYGLVSNNFSPTAAYHASKGAVVNFTRALGAEWAKRGVTVNAICPGFFASELTGAFINDQSFLDAVNAYCPMGRVGEPGELNAALIYLASNEASYTTGSMLSVDGGWTAI